MWNGCAGNSFMTLKHALLRCRGVESVGSRIHEGPGSSTVNIISSTDTSCRSPPPCSQFFCLCYLPTICPGVPSVQCIICLGVPSVLSIICFGVSFVLLMACPGVSIVSLSAIAIGEGWGRLCWNNSTVDNYLNFWFLQWERSLEYGCHAYHFWINTGINISMKKLYFQHLCQHFECVINCVWQWVPHWITQLYCHVSPALLPSLSLLPV